MQSLHRLASPQLKVVTSFSMQPSSSSVREEKKDGKEQRDSQQQQGTGFSGMEDVLVTESRTFELGPVQVLSIASTENKVKMIQLCHLQISVQVPLQSLQKMNLKKQ